MGKAALIGLPGPGKIVSIFRGFLSDQADKSEQFAR
jgi:hypothetical protein